MQTSASIQPPDLRPLLTAPEVAAVLAISLRKLEQLIAAHDAPAHFRVGRLRRWRATDVQAWIDARTEPQP
ncbi:MAG: helix-turn-helix transcriptional regulator [Roseateles sp.]